MDFSPVFRRSRVRHVFPSHPLRYDNDWVWGDLGWACLSLESKGFNIISSCSNLRWKITNAFQRASMIKLQQDFRCSLMNFVLWNQKPSNTMTNEKEKNCFLFKENFSPVWFTLRFYIFTRIFSTKMNVFIFLIMINILHDYITSLWTWMLRALFNLKKVVLRGRRIFILSIVLSLNFNSGDMLLHGKIFSIKHFCDARWSRGWYRVESGKLVLNK